VMLPFFNRFIPMLLLMVASMLQLLVMPALPSAFTSP
jgi:hypothetical protein